MVLIERHDDGIETCIVRLDVICVKWIRDQLSTTVAAEIAPVVHASPAGEMTT